MRCNYLFSGLALSAFAYAGPVCPRDDAIKNFIYIVPDGYGPASQTMARDFTSLMNGAKADAPVSISLPADELVIGNVRTCSSDSLITDSAASATAFACGVKTNNGVIALDEDGKPVGSILEAAKLDGLKTGLVVTSRITHATPAGYSAHVPDRDLENTIAEHQIGYSHPMGSVVDILMGGGRCHFLPQSDENSCRNDDIDLLSWANDQGFNTLTDLDGFKALNNGSDAKLPYIGLFNDDHMQYELDREPSKEPALHEMVTTALNSLKEATSSSQKGYFLMIEASRIDHAGHANDAAGHLHEVLEYNKVMDLVRSWINNHPDTIMLSAADHECGGLTLNGFNPLPLKDVSSTTTVLEKKFEAYDGDSPADYLKNTILPAYGITNATEDEIEDLVELKGTGKFGMSLGHMLAERAGVHWSTGDHTAVDVTLFGHAAGKRVLELKGEMAGNWDNTQLPGYIEKTLGVDIKDATKELRKNGVDWVPKTTMAKRDHTHKD
ncbi:Alkaline phosphatase [Aspergillus sclerotialis]|uniref:Alkaline phosphatase n=1 Tax=Aspergillus sclerotialis TaxID=2070753 RepID=A0A3A2ZPD3_9EURO|nr:Alkaline phosphatase [Aspergillus sclerotialis]